MAKKRTDKRQPTAEERSRAADHKLKRFISNSAIELGQQDPEIRRQMLIQTFGYKLPDPAEKSKRDLIAHMNELAIESIDKDPELKQKITDAIIRQALEGLGLIAEGEEWRKRPLSIQELIGKFKEIRELKEVLGVKEPGVFDALMNPEVITGILSLISVLLGGKQSAAANGVLVLVRIDGKDTLVTQEEFEQLKAQGQVKSLGDVESAEPNNPSKGNHTTSESETSNEAEGGDAEPGAVGSGD